MPYPLSLQVQKWPKPSVVVTLQEREQGDGAADAGKREATAGCEVLQNSFKVPCNTSLKGVGNLPHKTELKLHFELGLKRLSVVRDF